MNCEALRERITAEPALEDADFMRHAKDCAPCRAYHERLLRTERLIGKALRIDVPDRSSASAMPVQAQTGQRRFGWMLGAAASALLAVSVWLLVAPVSEVSADELAAAVVEHWDHEPESLLRTDVPVSDEQLTEVLGGTAELDFGPDTLITFVKMCRIAGQRVPHFVVQGEQGTFMVVLLPGRLLENSVPLEAREPGLAGHILPVGTGSIAVLGTNSEELIEVETLVSSAISWSI